MKTNHQHTYDLWYMQNRLQADYGSFTCDKCGNHFYHSPSTIYYHHAVKYNCCCGYCTNEIIFKDWAEKPYQKKENITLEDISEFFERC